MGWRDFSYGPWNWRMVHVLDDQSWETTGYVLAGISRSVFATWIGVYGVLALTGLGEAAQDCTTKKVNFGGIEVFTSSLVSVVLAIEGVVNAVSTPIFGAIADSTSYRTQLFRIVFTMLAGTFVGLGVGLFFTGETWALLYAAVLTVIGAMLFELQVILHAAYLPELSSEEDERLKLSARYHAIGSSQQLLFIGLSLGLGIVIGVSESKTKAPQIAILVALFLWAFWAIPGLALLDSRPKTAEQKGRRGFCGFAGLYDNIRNCFRSYRQLGIFLFAYSFYISGANALIGLATSYLLTELGISGFDLQILIGISLIFTIPGALLSNYAARKLGSLKRLTQAIVLLWILIVISIPILLVGEEDPDPTQLEAAVCAVEDSIVVARRPKGFSGIAVYLEAVFWGLGLGSIYPVNWSLAAELVPGGKEAGFFGLKTFSGKVFSALPPILFATINEATDNARLAISSMLPFLLIGFFILAFLDMDKAREEISNTLHLRHGFVEDIDGNSLVPAEKIAEHETEAGPTAKVQGFEL